MKKLNKRITINVDEDLYNLLLDIANKWHKSISYVLVRVIEKFLRGGEEL